VTAADAAPDAGVRRVAAWVREARSAVALTGAGISVDSGIPDFRSAGGLWEQFDPMEYATIQAFARAPEKVWTMVREMNAVIRAARPNEGHLALARLESAGKLAAIVTQNIDNLHQDAGSREVIEFHGNGRRLICLECGRRISAADAPRDQDPPRCTCARRPVLKPDVVFFGEMIPPEAVARANRAVMRCDLLLVVGTSGLVSPASEIPGIARRSGARIAEINLEPTPLTGTVAHESLRGSASVLLPRIADLALA
jgi:NAD-dependent deacetylase